MASGVTALDRAEKRLAPTAFPLDRPVTNRLVAPAAAGCRPPICAFVAALTTLTEYPVIGEPPLAGVVQVTEAEPFPAVAVPITGASGTATGVTVFDRPENGPVPIAFVAWTWNLTAVPLTRPVTFRLVAPAAAGCRPPIWTFVAALSTLTEYPVIGELPLVGVVQVTVAEAFPAVAVPITGAPGTEAGVTVLDSAENAPVPTAFVAWTLSLTAVPLA